MTSATPIAPCTSSSARTSAASSSAPALSNGDAGTQLDAHTPNVNGRCAAASTSAATPGMPNTLASSCGSAATAVVPHGRTLRTNSSTQSLVDSRCMWESMNPARERGAADVDDLDRVPRAPAHDDAVADREVGVDPLPRGGHEHPAAGEQQVGGCVARAAAGGSCGRVNGGGGWRVSGLTIGWRRPGRYRRASIAQTSRFATETSTRTARERDDIHCCAARAGRRTAGRVRRGTAPSRTAPCCARTCRPSRAPRCPRRRCGSLLR